MLEEIISYLNAILLTTKFHTKRFGLSELITKDETKSARFYCDGDWENTTVFSENLGTGYWRKISENISNIENTVGCEKLLEVTYTLRLVSVIQNKHLEKNDAYSSDKAAQSILKNIIQTNTTLKTTLKARYFSIDATSVNTDRESVMGLELSGVDKQDIRYDYSLFSIDFDVTVMVTENCMLELCDDTDFLCDLIAASNINDITLCLQGLPGASQTIICEDLGCAGGGASLPLAWLQTTNITVTTNNNANDTLTKSSGGDSFTDANPYGTSASYTSGEADIEFTGGPLTNGDEDTMCGWALPGNNNQKHDDINFCIYVDANGVGMGNFIVLELNVNKFQNNAAIGPNDTFQIRRRINPSTGLQEIKYYLNDILQYTSAVTPSGTYKIKCNFFTATLPTPSTITNIRVLDIT